MVLPQAEHSLRGPVRVSFWQGLVPLTVHGHPEHRAEVNGEAAHKVRPQEWASAM